MMPWMMEAPLSEAELKTIRLALTFESSRLGVEEWRAIARALLVTLDVVQKGKP